MAASVIPSPLDLAHLDLLGEVGGREGGRRGRSWDGECVYTLLLDGANINFVQEELA